jgi:hypothetical protein
LRSKAEGIEVGIRKAESIEVGIRTRRRPIGQDYAAAKDAEVGMRKSEKGQKIEFGIQKKGKRANSEGEYKKRHRA